MPEAVQEWVVAFGQWLYDRSGGWTFELVPQTLYKYYRAERVHVLRDCSGRACMRQGSLMRSPRALLLLPSLLQSGHELFTRGSATSIFRSCTKPSSWTSVTPSSNNPVNIIIRSLVTCAADKTFKQMTLGSATESSSTYRCLARSFSVNASSCSRSGGDQFVALQAPATRIG